jgi:hypothetical protein
MAHDKNIDDGTKNSNSNDIAIMRTIKFMISIMLIVIILTKTIKSNYDND